MLSDMVYMWCARLRRAHTPPPTAIAATTNSCTPPTNAVNLLLRSFPRAKRERLGGGRESVRFRGRPGEGGCAAWNEGEVGREGESKNERERVGGWVSE
eukprot:3442106-Rhodomonas_salina.2